MTNERIEFDLRFKTPFEGHNTGSWVIKSLGTNLTKVIWTMSAETTFPMTVFSLIFNVKK